MAKVPNLDDKLALAGRLEEAMGRALALRHHAVGLLERDETRLVADRRWIEPLSQFDRTEPPDRIVSGVLGDTEYFLLDCYCDLVGRLDPLLDARLVGTVRSAIERLESPVSPIGVSTGPRAPRGRLLDALVAARLKPIDATLLDDILWPSTDRVPVPARPAERQRPLPGMRGHFRKTSRLARDDLAGELNDNVMAEISALELLCRCSYEHPKQSWPFHMALARHATDEARHAAIFRRLLASNGIDESTLVQHGANYEHGYEFPECPPGSERELLWRLLLLCTVLEALAIDKLPVEIGGRDLVGQADFARALDYVSVDELFHVENGLRLTRQLSEKLNLDPTLERERVHGRFFGRQRDIRLEYLHQDPIRASAEIAILEAPDPDGVPYVSRTEVDLRLRASFSIDDCAQVERWQYNPIRHPLLYDVPTTGPHDNESQSD